MKRNIAKARAKYKREFSAGGVVYKKLKAENTGEVVWLIGKHSGYHKWVLPKGLIEEGERGFETAAREVEEEMGVKARVLFEKPIHRIQYFYWADLDNQEDYTQSDAVKGKRRVARYQESGGNKIRVFKVVSFYLMGYESGDPKDHDWEMEEAGWFSYKEALAKLAFEGEREVLTKAHDKIARRQDW